jgi:hypothetical protein
VKPRGIAWNVQATGICRISPLRSAPGKSFYALYDNGRSLFYEDTEETARRAARDPALYATSFGYAGTYWDCVREIAEEPGGLRGLINLAVSEGGIKTILTEAGFTGYRLGCASEWIRKTPDMFRELSG